MSGSPDRLASKALSNQARSMRPLKGSGRVRTHVLFRTAWAAVGSAKVRSGPISLTVEAPKVTVASQSASAETSAMDFAGIAYFDQRRAKRGHCDLTNAAGHFRLPFSFLVRSAWKGTEPRCGLWIFRRHSRRWPHQVAPLAKQEVAGIDNQPGRDADERANLSFDTTNLVAVEIKCVVEVLVCEVWLAINVAREIRDMQMVAA